MIRPTQAINYWNTWNLAWPMILSNISIPLVGAANIAIVGRLSSEVYIGAVALGVMILQSIYWSFSFLRKGTTGLVAQAVGQQKLDEVFLILFRALIFSTMLGLLITILQPLISWIAFTLVHASDEVEALAKVYFDIRIWGTIPTMANYVLLGWFYGINKPKLAFVLRLLMNVLNIPLAIYLVFVAKMGVAGVALSALLSHLVVCLASLICVAFFWIQSKIDWKLVLNSIWDYSSLIKVCRINMDLFVRTILVFLAFSWFTTASASRDSSLLAANTILINMFWFISYTLDGFANSAEILIGQAIGANDRERLRKSIVITTQYSFVFALIFTLVSLLAGEYFVSCFTSLPRVQELASQYLPFLAFMPLVSFMTFQLDGIFVGSTQTTQMMQMMIVSFVIYAIAILVLPIYLGNAGLWLALYVFMIVRAITLSLPLRGTLKSTDRLHSHPHHNAYHNA